MPLYKQIPTATSILVKQQRFLERKASFRQYPQAFILFFAISAIVLSVLPCHAQEEGFFEKISVEDGLSNKFVFSILVDSEGYLWAGTQYGLNRYDGYDFKVYRPSESPHSISSLTITALLEDQEGNFWIGTGFNGLNKLDKKTEQFTRYMHDPEDPTSLSHFAVRALTEDAQGQIWVGTHGGGLNKLTSEEGAFKHYRHDPADPNSLCSDFVTSLCTDSEGRLWAGTSNGLSRFDPDTGNFANFRHDLADDRSLASNFVTGIYSDDNGFLWLSVRGAVVRFDVRNSTFTSFAAAEQGGTVGSVVFKSVCRDSSGTVWAGTYNHGIYVVDQALGKAVPIKHSTMPGRGIKDNAIWTICEGPSGSVWFGTRKTGLVKYRRTGFKYYYHDPDNPDSLSYDEVLSFLEDDDGILWVGTDGGGLNRYDRSSGKFRSYLSEPGNRKSLSSNNVTALEEGKGDTLWVGTFTQGLNRLDKRTGVFERFMPERGNQNSLGDVSVLCLFSDSEGVLWVGLRLGGLNRFNSAEGNFTRFVHNPQQPGSLKGRTVLSIIEDDDSNLWLLTEEGLNKFNKKDETFELFKLQEDSNLQSPNTFFSGCLGSEGRLWLGTFQGIECFDRSKGRFVQFRGERELPKNVVLGILDDADGNLWLCTDYGLIVFDPDTGDSKVYDSSDGLQSEEFNVGAYYKKNKKGKIEMFIGGDSGFNSFFPDELYRNEHKPNIVFTSIRKYNEEIDLSPILHGEKPLVIGYDEKWISIEFAALDFCNPKRNRYAFMLEGVDEDWNYVGNQRRAEYTHLPPGNYVFKMRGSNNDGVWSDEVVELKVIVLPPFWEEWWFRLSVGGIIVGIAILLYLLRVHSIKVQRKRLTEEVEQRTKELKAFTFAASHNLRSPLWRADGLLRLLEAGLSEHLQGKMRENMLSLGKTLEKMHTTIDELMKLSRVSNVEIAREPVDLSLLARTCANGLQEIESDRQVRFEIRKNLMAHGDEQLLYIALENLFDNAWKFSSGNEETLIEFGARKAYGKTTFFVRDNGIGFEAERADELFEVFHRAHDDDQFPGIGVGLAIVRRIIRRHGGRIWAESEPGRGATFYFTLG